MSPLKSEQLRHIEQQLFEVHTRAERAKTEVEYFESQLFVAEQHATQAFSRLSVAETSLAQRNWCAAQKKVQSVLKGVESARVTLSELESARDELIAKLVG